MRASIPALLVLTALSSAVPIHRLPPLSDSYDAIAVFLPGGQPPACPWEGISDGFRERFWTFGCKGFLIQRTAWCAYLAVTPRGTAEFFAEEMASLGDSAVITDTSVWAGFLQLEPVNDAPGVAIVWSQSGEPTQAPVIPLRGSRWLAAGSDSLISNGPWSTSAFLWIPPPASEASYDGVWRGTGTEIVPVGPDRSVMVGVLCSTGITPAELQFAGSVTHDWDAEFGAVWSPVFRAVDSLVEAACPVATGRSNLLWLKGSGAGSPFEPWKTSAAPAPPARSRSAIQAPPGLTVLPAATPMPSVAGISMVTIPCTGASEAETAVFSGVLERILARSALPEIPGIVSAAVEPVGDSIRIWVAGNGEIDAGKLSEMLPRLLGPTALCPPESELVANSTLRAFVRYGRRAPDPSPTTMVHILAGVLGLLN